LLELARIQREAGMASPAVEAATLRLDAMMERGGPMRAELAEVQALLEGVSSDAYELGDEDHSMAREGMQDAQAEKAEDADASVEADAASAAPAETAAAVEVALNGAQAQFLVDVVGAVARGELPKSSGIAAVRIALPMVPSEQVDAMFADVVEGSTAPPAPAVP
jgi:hypothetical protein